MFDPRFQAQVSLVIRCLPEVAKHDCFALKGGTAINLFVRDLPRVSVDIDLTYLPVKPRDESLREISNTLRQIGTEVKAAVPRARVLERHMQGYVAKLSVAADDTEITIEPNLVLRGGISDPTIRELSTLAQRHFRASARIQTHRYSVPQPTLGDRMMGMDDRDRPEWRYFKGFPQRDTPEPTDTAGKVHLPRENRAGRPTPNALL